MAVNIVKALESKGYRVKLLDFTRDVHEGYQFHHKGVEIVFRQDDDQLDTLIITWIKNISGHDSLLSPFHALDWFAGFIKQSDFGIRRLKGLIRPEKILNGMSGQRMARFYTLRGANSLGFEFGEEWYGIDLEVYKPRPINSQTT